VSKRKKKLQLHHEQKLGLLLSGLCLYYTLRTAKGLRSTETRIKKASKGIVDTIKRTAEDVFGDSIDSVKADVLETAIRAALRRFLPGG
jgi:hypothetical protein